MDTFWGSTGIYMHTASLHVKAKIKAIYTNYTISNCTNSN